MRFNKQHLPIMFMLILICWGLFQVSNFKIHDFGNYYFAAVNWSQDFLGAELFKPASFNQWIHDHFDVTIFASYSPSPPSTFYFFIPFTWLSPLTAKMVWVVLNSIVGILAFKRMQQISSASWNSWTVALLVCISAFYYEILFGQLYLFLLFLLVEGFYQFRNNHLWSAAFLWSLAIALKFFPIIIFGFLWSKGEWKTIWRTFLVTAMMALFFVWLTGIELWNFYINTILSKANFGFINTAFNQYFQSPVSWLNHLFVFDELSNPTPLAMMEFMVPFAKAILLGILLGIAVFVTRKSVHNYFQDFSLWLVLGLLLSPSGSTYSMLLAAPLLFAFLTTKHPISFHFLLGSLLFLAINIPIRWTADWPVIFQFPRLYFMLVIFIVITYKHLSKSALFTIGLGCVLFLIPAFLTNSTSDKAEYVLNSDYAVVTDFDVKDNKLAISILGEHGIEYKSLEVHAQFEHNQNLVIDDNQIYFEGRQLTYGLDQKAKPKLSKDGFVYYLSDYRRGHGFYTLRKLKLR